MPIENPETEFLWADVYEPVLLECGFNPDRIDKSEDGSDIPPQILKKITNANLIIADLTMERQNCYLELGYALGKHQNHASIILCCREDHNPRSPRHVSCGPQVHFDVITRNIIWWDSKDCDAFKKSLITKIESRRKQIDALRQAPETEAANAHAALSFSRGTHPKLSSNIDERLKKARQEFSK